MKREKFKLNDEEIREFKALYPDHKVAFEFWKAVAERRGIDYKSIIGIISTNNINTSFTALPLGHGMDWCYPSPLKCSFVPKQD